MSTRNCKECKEEKCCLYSHLGKNGSGVYKDSEGKLWKGNVCCQCQAKKRKESRKSKKPIDNVGQE